MELELIRAYDPDGTNGELRCDGKTICFTIELPWLQNQRNISCIPEGRYELKKRFVQKFGLHLLVVNVPDRSWILIHPANDATTQLKGCIAPVTNLVTSGKGSGSRLANEKLKALVLGALERKEKVFITIKPKIK
ncbi:MAG: DUF5675 family protein [Flammeovirgaceae bacterium]|jgi:hypothetical protein|nr:DUF5675 family protein [Flammeovirgaceae bacterium]